MKTNQPDHTEEKLDKELDLKTEIWEIIEKSAPNLSNDIGWGSMDSLCDNLKALIHQERQRLLKEMEKMIETVPIDNKKFAIETNMSKLEHWTQGIKAGISKHSKEISEWKNQIKDKLKELI